MGSGFDDELRYLRCNHRFLLNLLTLIGGFLFVLTAALIPCKSQILSIRPSPLEGATRSWQVQQGLLG